MIGSSYFIDVASGATGLPPDYSVSSMAAWTRDRLRAPGELLDEALEGYEQGARALTLSFVEHACAPWLETDAARDGLPRPLIGLLSALSTSNTTSRGRRDAALAHLLDELDFFTGFSLEVTRSSSFQFGQGTYWVSSGNFAVNDRFARAHAGDPGALRAAGFARVTRNGYIERARTPIIQLKLADAATLSPWAAIIALYTASRHERADMGGLFDELREVLLLRAHERLERWGPTVPLKPLFSLPREMRGMGSFFVSCGSELSVDPKGYVRAGGVATAGAALHEPGRAGGADPGRPRVLFFDDDLVNTGSEAGDTFIAVEVASGQTDVFGAVLAAIEGLGVEPSVLEHVPRVCAGMFSAAQRDRRMRFVDPGTFWDTDAGARLCRIVGFDPTNHKHRARIQQARALLETITLHRTVRARRADGGTQEVRWAGPLLERRRARLELDRTDREGMSARHTFSSWSIARPLWDMVLPEREGGAPAFMSIDARAFLLDPSSSTPFNLYWAMVNRAYMGTYAANRLDRVDEAGTFHPRIGVLYDFSGMQGTHRRLYRLRRALRGALDAMVDHGLLLRWECPWLTDGATVSFAELFERRVRVTFSERQLRNLSKSLATRPEGDAPVR